MDQDRAPILEDIVDHRVEYLRTGLECGMVTPDAGDAGLVTIRVAGGAEPGTPGT